MKNIRIGIDFGYRYTGIAALDQDHKVLLHSVIEHKNISDILLKRRGNRSARRRKHTKIVRLRNFYALLKSMGIEPKTITKKSTQADKEFIGNQLYAMVHRRGWDYSSLVELLIDEGKSTPTLIVRTIDQLLVDDFNAPHIKKLTRKRIKTTCMGELAEYQSTIAKCQSTIAKCQKTIDRKNITDAQRETATNAQQEAAQQEVAQQEAKLKYEKLHYRLDNADIGVIEGYINERLEKSGVVEKRIPDALEHIKSVLGLSVGKNLHDQGKLYTPHKNRHRNEFVQEIKEKMEIAFTNPLTQQKAEQIATSQNMSVQAVQEGWLKNAIAIMDPNSPERGHKKRKKNNKDIRPARFLNRHIGKCPAKPANGVRCNRNVPKKYQEEIRRLQYEIEARQMNIQGGGQDGGHELSKLTDEEIGSLLSCVDFKNAKLVDGGEEWDKFFAAHKTPRVRGDARGKKDILKDIATGAQSGRSGLCKQHLQEKLNLLKNEQTRSDDWARLHQERQLSIYSNDAPPSIHQKVEVVINTLKKSLKDLGYDLNNLPIDHIGIEAARFDISALAQNEGKKFKSKKDYQKKSSRTIDALKKEQDHRCLYCGEKLSFAHADHIFPKARKGSDRALNRAAAHDICNINKGKGFIEIDPTVLSVIKKNNPKKYEYIARYSKQEWSMQNDSLAGAQHTMFGAKLLKGSLIDALGLQQLSEEEIKKIFPKIDSRETTYLRKNWFPFMNRQKSVLRYENNESVEFMRVVIGQNHPKPVQIKWPKKLSDDIRIEVEHPEKLKHWVKYQTITKGQERMTEIKISDNYVFKQGDERILSYRFNAIDRATDEIKHHHKLHIVIRPAKEDGIYMFHHAVDAIVAATKLDWAQLNRINNKIRTDDEPYKKRVQKAIASDCPKVDLRIISLEGKDEYIAPNEIDFLKKDKRKQSRPKVSKTDTQALRINLLSDKITQRKSLCTIPKTNTPNIQSMRIRRLMEEAFTIIANKTDEEKRKYFSVTGKNKCITQNYFLQLPKKHPLHPINARSVRCIVGGVGKEQLFKIYDKKIEGTHHYKKTVPWEKAVVYEYSENGKKKCGVKRLTNEFYINQYNHPDDLLVDAKIIEEFKRGDKVTHPEKKGVWEISELGKNATLTPYNLDAVNYLPNSRKDTTSAYRKLTHVIARTINT